MSFSIIIDCFIVIVIGGLGNIRGAILGALLIGMTRAVGQQFARRLDRPADLRAADPDPDRPARRGCSTARARQA